MHQEETVKTSTALKVLKWVCLGIYVTLFAVIIIEAATNGENSSSQSSWVTDLVVKIFNIDAPAGSDKYAEIHNIIRKAVGHFSVFAVFALAGDGFISIQFRKPLPLAIAAGASIVIGVGTAFFSEFIQTLTPGRAGQFEDVGIDIAGYATGFLIGAIVYLIVFLVRRRKTRQTD